jgi:hypothetical protein
MVKQSVYYKLDLRHILRHDRKMLLETKIIVQNVITWRNCWAYWYSIV